MGIKWKDKLPEALWTYQTAYKTPIGMSPYQLVYEKTCHLLVELEFKAHWAIKRWNTDFYAARTNRKMQLSELEEWRERGRITVPRSTRKEPRDGTTRES
jgi:hypothetical protein